MKSRYRLHSAASFVLVVAITVLALPSVALAQATITSSYCITGTGNGTPFAISWVYDDGNGPYTGSTQVWVPVGATCNDFASGMADSISAFSNPAGPIGTATGCCFTITMPPAMTWLGLYVGPLTNPMACLVTTSGCTFNPTIVLNENPVGVESPNWGTVRGRYSYPADH